MKFHSFAAGGVEPRDPEEIREIDVDPASDSESAGSADLGSPYKLVLWSGNGYTSRNAWIACEEDYLINLEDTR